MLPLAANVVLSSWFRPIKSSSGQPPGMNHNCFAPGVSCCYHCDGEVVIHSTGGCLVFITRLLPTSKIQAFLRAFYTGRIYTHCPINTATTHIGSHCACSRGQCHFVSFWVTGLGQSKAAPDNHPEPNHNTKLRCRHSDGEVVIHSTNGHLVFITRLFLMSKIQAFLKAFYTVRYIDDAKRQFEYSVGTLRWFTI